MEARGSVATGTGASRPVVRIATETNDEQVPTALTWPPRRHEDRRAGSPTALLSSRARGRLASGGAHELLLRACLCLPTVP